jgi:hypothetical protein
LAALIIAWPTADGTEGQQPVPAIMFFGDSLVDVGNNDYIHTIVKADAPPYGRDLEDNVATGRFGNGLLLSDIIGWSQLLFLFLLLDICKHLCTRVQYLMFL